MYYVYEYHLTGDVYIEEEELEYEDTYCEQCGDSDRLLGVFATMNEAIEFKVEMFRYNNALEDDDDEILGSEWI